MPKETAKPGAESPPGLSRLLDGSAFLVEKLYAQSQAARWDLRWNDSFFLSNAALPSALLRGPPLAKEWRTTSDRFIWKISLWPLHALQDANPPGNIFSPLIASTFTPQLPPSPSVRPAILTPAN